MLKKAYDPSCRTPNLNLSKIYVKDYINLEVFEKDIKSFINADKTIETNPETEKDYCEIITGTMKLLAAEKVPHFGYNLYGKDSNGLHEFFITIDNDIVENMLGKVIKVTMCYCYYNEGDCTDYRLLELSCDFAD
ncbi:MAG: hypothetical protein ACI4JM_07335 [Oscillospiraceae bacterium]